MKLTKLFRKETMALFLMLSIILLSAFGVNTVYAEGTGIFTQSDQFTSRDLEQTPDLSGAVYLNVADQSDLRITDAGVYVISGNAANATIYVEATSDDKVQLVLQDVSIQNSNFPCIYVTKADKVFVTVQGNNSLTVTGRFQADGSTNTDGVIFSKSDLVLNGTGALMISSTENGIVCKDDLKITGGTYNITAASKTLEANDSIRIAGGSFTLKAGTDGLHAENDSDSSLGYIYITGGIFTITAGDDAIHGQSVIQIDDGEMYISAAEGVEGTYIQLNGGTISIQGRDDGINAANKSDAYRTTIEINGGSVTVVMGSGDTDGIDSNGDLYINGGVINVTGGSTFDCDGIAQYNGGTIIVNGQQVDSIPNQRMGGGRGQQSGGWQNGGGQGGKKR